MDLAIGTVVNNNDHGYEMRIVRETKRSYIFHVDYFCDFVDEQITVDQTVSKSKVQKYLTVTNQWSLKN